MCATDNLTLPIVVHCQYCRSKKNYALICCSKKSSVRIDKSFISIPNSQLSTLNSQLIPYSASVKSSCFFSRLACATFIFIGSPSWYLW